MIRFDRVRFRYNAKQETSFAIEEVSFSLEKGKIHGFVGGNGSGKTTFAQLIAGILLPLSGTVEVCGINTVARDAEIHRKVGIIFQNPDNQIVGTTVEEDIAFGLENLAVPTDEIQIAVKNIAREFSIGHLLETPVHHLSGGQKQIVCIASVMVMQPEWIIFDEPTSHLDPWSRKDFWKTLKKLVEEKKVGVIVISQISEDFDNFDQIRVFAEGKSLWNGEIHKIKKVSDLKDAVEFPHKWQLEAIMGNKHHV
jgi:energy-coupling factor transport system ATP-binding protein